MEALAPLGVFQEGLPKRILGQFGLLVVSRPTNTGIRSAQEHPELGRRGRQW
jgi:hypothetical protein